jgi:hypothetical protein
MTGKAGLISSTALDEGGTKEERKVKIIIAKVTS